MDVFKIDVDQSQIRSSLVVDKTNAGCAGGDADDDEELIPEVSFDANSDFNLHFFDTPEDSSTQGGFSDAGSIESESLASPTPPPATQQLTSGCLEPESLQLLGGFDECKASYFASNNSNNGNNSNNNNNNTATATSASLHANCSSYRNAAAAASTTTATATATTTAGSTTEPNRGAANFDGCAAVGSVVGGGGAAGAVGGGGACVAAASSTLVLGPGGGSLYAQSCNNQYNQSHSSSSSVYSSASSSSAGGGCGGVGGVPTTAGSATLGVEHFIGGNNHSAASVSATTAAAAAVAAAAATTTSLAHVKLQPDQQQFVVADSNTSNVSKAFVPCKVCGDKASGYHYGVTSCEGCKGFFRRSIQKQIEYRCLRDGKCLVIRLNRNRCQYCRFKKCLSAGMSRDSVRYGRVPKRSRELNSTPSSTDESNLRVSTPGTPNTPQTPQMCSVASPVEMGCNAQLSTDAEVPGAAADLTVYDVILCVSQAHRMHCTYTEEQTRELMRIPIVVPQNGIANSIAESLEFQKIWLWQQYSARITPGVQRIVEFAKRVPGFCDFTQDDQLILIKLGFFEVWLSQVARMINDSTLTFDDGAYLTRQQLEILYDGDFVNALINFANTVNAYGLSDTEIGLFSAMVLLASDRSGITEHKVISRARERIAEGLRVQIVRSRPGSAQALQLMPALEAKIPELRALGAKHFSHLDWLRMNWTKQRLPPLFAEIFDIPKPEDDL